MSSQVQAHKTNVLLVKTVPAEVYAGCQVALKVKVACPSKCDLGGGIVRIVAGDGAVVHETELVSFDGAANVTEEIAFRSPTETGEYVWTAVLLPHEQAGIRHEESSVSFSFVVNPHATSMAVWHVPSPIVVNDRFKIYVGVQCSAECPLSGKPIAIYDVMGAQVATGTLGKDRWSHAGALYWTEAEVKAPGQEGYYSYRAKFVKQDVEQFHEEASFAFAFRTAKQPEHAVTVEVLDKEDETPMQNAEVILHPYRQHTGEGGKAVLSVPKGEYELYVSAFGKQTFQTTVKVASDVAIRTELVSALVEDTSG